MRNKRANLYSLMILIVSVLILNGCSANLVFQPNDTIVGIFPEKQLKIDNKYYFYVQSSIKDNYKSIKKEKWYRIEKHNDFYKLFIYQEKQDTGDFPIFGREASVAGIKIFDIGFSAIYLAQIEISEQFMDEELVKKWGGEAKDKSDKGKAYFLLFIELDHNDVNLFFETKGKDFVEIKRKYKEALNIVSQDNGLITMQINDKKMVKNYFSEIAERIISKRNNVYVNEYNKDNLVISKFVLMTPESYKLKVQAEKIGKDIDNLAKGIVGAAKAYDELTGGPSKRKGEEIRKKKEEEEKQKREQEEQEFWTRIRKQSDSDNYKEGLKLEANGDLSKAEKLYKYIVDNAKDIDIVERATNKITEVKMKREMGLR